MNRYINALILIIWSSSFCLQASESLVPTAYRTTGPGGLSVTSFDRDGKRAIGGYFDTELFLEEGKASTFKAHRFVLDISSYVHNSILVNAEIEYEYGGYITNADETKTIQKGELKIEQAWVDIKINPVLTQRTGIIVVPFGRVNVLHDSDLRDATERPLYARYIVPSTWMDTGVGIHGDFTVKDWDLHYQLYMINGLSDQTGTSSDDISMKNGIRKARPNFKKDNNGDKAIVARGIVSPFLGLDLGISAYRGSYDDAGSSDIVLLGADGLYKHGRYEWVGEFAHATVEKNDHYATLPSRMMGGYIECRAHVLQSYLASKWSQFRSPVVTLFTRHGAVDTDGYRRIRHMIGFNVRPTETTVYKLEYRVDTTKQSASKTAEGAVIASVAVGF